MFGLHSLIVPLFHLGSRRLSRLFPINGRYRVRLLPRLRLIGQSHPCEIRMYFRKRGARSDLLSVHLSDSRYRIPEYYPPPQGRYHGYHPGLSIAQALSRHLVPGPRSSLHPVRVRLRPRVPPLPPVRPRTREYILYQGRRLYLDDGPVWTSQSALTDDPQRGPATIINVDRLRELRRRKRSLDQPE